MQIRVTRHGRITIPVALRAKFGIANRTRIVVIDDGNSIILKPITELYLRALQGSLKRKGGMAILMHERRRQETPEASQLPETGR